jgi:hypothetical protein
VLSKYKARAVKQEIDRVLWEIWDPIGVRGMGGPSDEYQAYVNGVYELLASGASDNQLAEHLLSIVADRMGLSGATIEAMHPTVEALRAIRWPTDNPRQGNART